MDEKLNNMDSIHANLTENSNNEVSDIPSKKNKLISKKLLIGFALLIIIIISLLLFLWISGIKKEEAPKSTTKSNPIIDREYIKNSAREIVDYINSQRRPDGYYEYMAHYDENCTIKNGAKKCPFDSTRMFETTNAWAALGNFAAYKILGDQKYLDQSFKDLKKLEEWCKKDRSKCSWVLMQPSIIFDDTKSEDLKKFLNLQSEVLMAQRPSKNSMLAAIEARELFKLANMFPNKNLAIEAKERLSFSMKNIYMDENYIVKDVPGFSSSTCWISLAYIENILVENDNNKINNVIAFLDNAKLDENFNKIKSALFIQPCIESYFLINKYLNKDESYNVKAEILFKMFLESYFDSRLNRKIYGEGGTLSEIRTGFADHGMVNLTDSSYTLYLISLLLDE